MSFLREEGYFWLVYLIIHSIAVISHSSNLYYEPDPVLGKLLNFYGPHTMFSQYVKYQVPIVNLMQISVKGQTAEEDNVGLVGLFAFIPSGCH